MTRLSTSAVCAIAFGLLLGATSGASTAPQSQPASTAQVGPIEPEALEGLKRMGAYLGTLTSFEVKADTTLDLVMKSGQRVQVGGTTLYKVHRPDGFQIDLITDLMNRRFYFDGKQFTIFAPDLGYYATTPAPPTIRDVLDVVYDKFGISLPLDDLFRWSDPNNPRAEKLNSGFVVGPATVDGAATDHYAFREGNHDWEIWIQKGDKPLPRKLVIVDRSDADRPTYVARLSWNESPTLAATDFTFTPGPDAKLIHLADLSQ